MTRNPEKVDPWVADRVELIMNGIARLAGLLDEFRSLSRRQRFQFTATDLSALVEHLVEEERAAYEARGVRVELAIEPNVPLVLADAEKLDQVLLNLCKNAVEAMPSGGALHIRVAPTAIGAAIEVGDTGVGIPEDLDVFEPFSSSKAEGTGLGLPIVRQIVAAHRGSIDYRRNPAGGTTFRVELPA
jgi:signal transduction histidine kinase